MTLNQQGVAMSDQESSQGVEKGAYSRWFFRTASVSWFVFGLLILLAAFDDTKLEHERLLRRPDEVLGFNLSHTMIGIAVFHFLVGILLVWARDFTIKVLILFLGISVCGIYRLGLSWLATMPLPPGKSFSVVTLVGEQVGMRPGTFGNIWLILLLGMAVGVALSLVVERYQRKKAAEREFMDKWKRAHKDRGQFPWAG